MSKWTEGERDRTWLEGYGPPWAPEAAEPDPSAPPGKDTRPFLRIPAQDIDFGAHSSFPGDGFCMGIVSVIVEPRRMGLGNRLVNAVNQTVAGFTPVGFGMAIAKAMLEALAGEDEWTEAQKRLMAAMEKDWKENPPPIYGSEHRTAASPPAQETEPEEI